MTSPELLTYLSVIPDPRIERNKKHDLAEMLFVASCAVISGAERWADIVEFAESKTDWLRRFVKLDNGIPVDDTFARVLSKISPQVLHNCFLSGCRSETDHPISSRYRTICDFRSACFCTLYQNTFRRIPICRGVRSRSM